jgi:cell division protein FtsZ
LLKIVSGIGDDEIKMSELSKIKNKIQQSAGRDVNIIEGIGFDADLGSAVSVTVIATGFKTKKINEPVTIRLEDNDQLDYENNESNNIIASQQTLSLEDDSFETEDTNSSQINSSVEDVSCKTILELEDETEQMNDPSDLILDIVEEKTDNHLDCDDVIKTEQEMLSINNQSMCIEAREREERLREISIKLRTPSGLTKLEDEPAFKRNNIDLDEVSHSSEDDVSHYTLTDSEDDKIILKDNNSYLHDNVD